MPLDAEKSDLRTPFETDVAPSGDVWLSTIEHVIYVVTSFGCLRRLQC